MFGACSRRQARVLGARDSEIVATVSSSAVSRTRPTSVSCADGPVLLTVKRQQTDIRHAVRRLAESRVVVCCIFMLRLPRGPRSLPPTAPPPYAQLSSLLCGRCFYRTDLAASLSFDLSISRHADPSFDMSIFQFFGIPTRRSFNIFIIWIVGCFDLFRRANYLAFINLSMFRYSQIFLFFWGGDLPIFLCNLSESSDRSYRHMACVLYGII